MKTLHIASALLLTLGMQAAFAQTPSAKQKDAKVEGDVQAGRALFEVKCGVCHNSDSNEKKIGPGLKGVKDGALPSGKSATERTILEKLNAGGGGMPVFKELLTDKEKADIVAYVLTL